MSHSATAHYRTIGYCRKPAPTKERPFKRSSLGQSISTSIDISPIIGTPLSSDCEQNPFSDSYTGSSDLSVQSSAYSTESKLACAKTKARKRKEELRSIRRKSKGVQEYLLERLQKTEGKSRFETVGLDYYEQELERMKDSLCSMQVGETLFRNSLDVEKLDMSHQLNQMQQEIQHMRESLSMKQRDIRQQEAESEELKQVVKSLEKTVLDLGGSVDYAGVAVEARQKELGKCSCSLF